jgi:hypothetical protein
MVPCFGVLAAVAFVWSARSYDADVAKVSGVALAVAP